MNAFQQRRSPFLVIHFVLIVNLVLFATMNNAYAVEQLKLRTIILSSQTLGAHGMGYGQRSLERLARWLAPEDVPALLDLHADDDMRVGVQFALASQCEAGLRGVMRAVKNRTFHAFGGKRVDYSAAQDTLHLIAHFDRCDPKIRQMAKSAHTELEQARQAEQARMQKEYEEKQAADARVQASALKLLQGGTSTLTKAEREEVYARSLRAAGLDGPRTPEQEELVKRMHDGMVLETPSNPRDMQTERK